MCAQGMLARREHSRLELEQKLRKKDYQAEEIVQVLDKLLQKDWQSDLRFCQSFIRSRVNKGQGPNKICYDLKQRGVCATIVNEQLQIYKDDWLNLCKNLYQKKYSSTKSTDIKLQARQMRFLSSRGFTQDIIQKVIRK